MLETDPGPQAMAAIHTMQKDQQEQTAQAAHTGDFSKLYLLSSTDAQIAAAQAAILSDGRPLTRQLFAQLAESHSLYQEHGVLATSNRKLPLGHFRELRKNCKSLIIK